MKQKVNYTILGFSVVSLSVMMLALFFWLYSDGHVQEFKTYLLRTKEGVSGLTRESAVLYSGVKVGYVEEIQIDHDDPDVVNILIQVDKKVPITVSTVATLNTRGLTGVIYVSLKNKTNTHVLLQKTPPFNCPVIPVQKSLLSQLINLIPNVGKTIKASSEGMEHLFSEDNIKNFSAALQHMNSITKTYDANQQKILAQLTQTLKKIDAASDTFQHSTEHFDRVVKSSGVMVDNFTQQSLTQLPTLFQQLSSITLNLKQLAAKVRSEPSLLVRGKSIEHYGPGER